MLMLPAPFVSTDKKQKAKKAPRPRVSDAKLARDMAVSAMWLIDAYLEDEDDRDTMKQVGPGPRDRHLDPDTLLQAARKLQMAGILLARRPKHENKI